MSESAKPLAVLVTGAASGIGKACARKLLAEGHEVVALDLADAPLKAAFPEDSTRLVRFAGDVSHAASCQSAVQAAVARFGRLDAVTHWAAAHSTTFWTDLGAEEFNRILSINVTGAFLIAQAAGEHMRRRGSGSIVLTSSTSMLAGAMGGKTGSGGPAYVASKAAIIGLVRTMANALGREGVRVNAIAPGVVDTPMIDTYSPEHLAAQPVPLSRGAAEESLRGRLALGEHARHPTIVLSRDGETRRLLAQQAPQPASGGFQRIDVHAVEPARRLGPRGHPAVVGEDLQVPADRRLRHLEDRAQLRHGELMAFDQAQDAQPGRVAERTHPGEHGRACVEIHPSIRIQR